MATSIDDLLTAIGATAPNRTDPDDAAEALRWSALLLSRLREEGGLLLADPGRDRSARLLEDACRYAATSFPGNTGRASELLAATHDVVGRLRDQLSHDDRWAITTHLAMAARRFAGTIAHSGPYHSVPELPAVAERAQEVLHLAAARPVRLDRLRGLDLPIPTPEPIATRSVITAAAELAGELSRSGRQPLTMREITAACHAAYQLAAYVAIAAKRHGMDVAFSAHQLARSWNDVRQTVALYVDAAPRSGETSALSRAIRLDAAVRHALDGDAATPQVSDSEIRLVSRHLGRLASSCHAEIVGLGPRLFVPRGPKPLSEERVAAWLQHETFVVTDHDLRPALSAFERAQCHAVALHEVAVAARVRCCAHRNRVEPSIAIRQQTAISL